MNLNLHESLTFSAPEPVIDGQIQFVSFKPSSGGPYQPVSVKLSPNNQFLVPDRSYIKFKLTPSITSKLNLIGGSSVFHMVSETHSGTQLPIQRNWNIANSLQLATDTSERKTVTQLCEEFYGGAIASRGDSPANTDIEIVCPVPSVLRTTKYIPLCLYNAGLTYSYQLAPAGDVFSTGSYTVKDIEIVACLVTPVQSYLQEVASGIEKGQTLKLSVTLTKSYTTALAGASQTPTINLSVGYMTSMNTLSLVNKTGMAYSNNLNDYYIIVDSVRYPLNKQITGERESVYQTLAGYSTQISTIARPAAEQHFKHHSWESNLGYLLLMVHWSYNSDLQILQQELLKPSSVTMP